VWREAPGEGKAKKRLKKKVLAKRTVPGFLGYNEGGLKPKSVSKTKRNRGKQPAALKVLPRNVQALLAKRKWMKKPRRMVGDRGGQRNWTEKKGTNTID